MNIRPAISVPLPWLTILTGKIFGKKNGIKRRSFLKPPRSLSFTGEGKWFIGILFLIGIAAINTGNNLLYLIVATLLSLIITSGILSESTLRGVKARRILPRHIFKGTPVICKLHAENIKKIFPSFSFNIKELPAAGVKGGSCYILRLDPGRSVIKTQRYIFEKRGRHTLTGLSVSTRFPFGLFIKGKVEPMAEEVIVYPRIRPIKEMSQPDLPNDTGTKAAGRGKGPEIYGLRDYTFEDDSRFIHWKSAAKSTKLLVKDFERERENNIVIILDNYLPDNAEAFEKTVDDAATLVSYYISKYYSVGLKTLSEEIKPRPGHDQLYRILYLLAVICPENMPGRPGVRVKAIS